MANAATWRQRVRAWRASGETAGDFVQGKGFTESTLRWWAWKLGESEAPEEGPKAPRLVRVVRGEQKTNEVVGRDAAAITIELGAARVSVKSGVDRTTLREVLEVLGTLATEGGR